MTLMAQTMLLAWVPGYPELLVILIIAVIVFGKRLPDVARSLGKSIVEFKRGLNEVQRDVESAAELPDETPEKPAMPDNSAEKPKPPEG